ncbi:MAG: type IV pilin-like G/H family protein [Cyanobacteria bacterium P01_E01_bin.42]
MSDRDYNTQQTNAQQKPKRMDGATIGWLYIYVTYMYSFLFLLVFGVGSFFKDRSRELVKTRNISRGQQAYFLEAKTFARRLESLGVGQIAETEDYSHRIIFPSQPIQTQPSLASEFKNLPAIASIAYPKDDDLRVYIGIVQTTRATYNSKLTTQARFCHSASSLGALKSQGAIDFGFPYFADLHSTEPDRPCPTNFQTSER